MNKTIYCLSQLGKEWKLNNWIKHHFISTNKDFPYDVINVVVKQQINS